ncbi:MAG: hypothetical protein PUF97_04965 [Bifidobacteriaceae bacterium]|nr:hypothetical protein [Bifidobacteriaceae bacterium]
MRFSRCRCGGGLLLSIGVVGEYIGRIYLEAKARPRYIVESFIDGDNGFVTPGGPVRRTPDAGASA